MATKQNPALMKAFAGLRNGVDPSRFAPSDLAVATNVDIDKTGRVTRREGYTKFIEEAAHSLWANRTVCLYVNDTRLVRLHEDLITTTVIRDDLTAGARMGYCDINNVIYYSNGFQSGVFNGNSLMNQSWGLPVPLHPTVTLTSGSMPAGTYQLVLTTVRADGQESGAREGKSLTLPANSGITVNLPSYSDSVDSINIYLSTPDGAEMYLAATVMNGQASYTYTGDTTELSLPLSTQYMSGPPAGRLIAQFKGHTFIAQDDTLYISEPFAPELFDLRNYIQLDARVTLLAKLEEKSNEGSGGFFIGTTKSCGILTGSGPADFQYVPKQPYGAIYGTLDFVEGTLFDEGEAGARMIPMWLTTEGICAGLPGMEIQNLTRSKYGFNATGEGAALFKPELNQFIVISNL